MNQEKLKEKVCLIMDEQCKKKGYSAPVEVLMDLGVLSKEKYMDWRNGRVIYLEKVCTTNLSKLAFILKTMQIHAKENSLKASFTYYKKYGKGNIKLRFSKTGNPIVERQYATHYVGKTKV